MLLGVPEKWKALSLGIWLTLPSADAIRDSHHGGRWDPRRDVSGFSSLPNMSQDHAQLHSCPSAHTVAYNGDPIASSLLSCLLQEALPD